LSPPTICIWKCIAALRALKKASTLAACCFTSVPIPRCPPLYVRPSYGLRPTQHVEFMIRFSDYRESRVVQERNHQGIENRLIYALRALSIATRDSAGHSSSTTAKLRNELFEFLDNTGCPTRARARHLRIHIPDERGCRAIPRQRVRD
jgi:hypothetical protein